MKEITFEELIIQLFPNHELTKDMWSFELMQFSADDLIEFGKQVREATIAECKDKIWNENGTDKENEKVAVFLSEYTVEKKSLL